SPLSAAINVDLALAMARNRHYADAVTRLERSLDLDAAYWRAYAVMAMTYEAQGDWAKAIPSLEKASALDPDGLPWLGNAYAIAGRRRDALAVLARIEARARTEYVSPQDVAFVSLGLGDEDRALAGLEQACEDRAIDFIGLAHVDGRLHDHPRVQGPLGRMRMPAARRGPGGLRGPGALVAAS